METTITRMYTGADGESHFEDVRIPLQARGATLHLSDLMKATGIVFGEVNAENASDWHNAPRRQYAIGLEGEHEVEVGDGTRRLFGPGDVLLAEDTTGRGHTIHLINGRPYKVAYITAD